MSTHPRPSRYSLWEAGHLAPLGPSESGPHFLRVVRTVGDIPVQVQAALGRRTLLLLALTPFPKGCSVESQKHIPWESEDPERYHCLH